MVRKCLKARATTNQLDNMWVVDQIKQSLSRHTNIQQVSASISHGSYLYFMWEYVEEPSLDTLLRSPESVMDNPEAFPIWFSPHNLISETRNLAQAVNFLHNQLYIGRGQRLTCTNLDLSLENITVSLPSEIQIDESPVGRWKIKDFGKPALRTITSSRYRSTPAQNTKDSDEAAE